MPDSTNTSYRDTQRILVIDDIREFEGATHAKTATAGLRLLQEQEWDEVWLDHDLGGDETIRPVVAWMEENHPANEPIIHVISLNPVGANYIVAALRSAYDVYRSPNGTGLGLKVLKNV